MAEIVDESGAQALAIIAAHSKASGQRHKCSLEFRDGFHGTHEIRHIECRQEAFSVAQSLAYHEI